MDWRAAVWFALVARSSRGARLMFYDDIVEPADERVLDEGRKRLRTTGLSDEQINEWITTTRRRGGRIELTADGLRAVYP